VTDSLVLFPRARRLAWTTVLQPARPILAGLGLLDRLLSSARVWV